MKTFINASTVKLKEEKTNEKKLNIFIGMFNNVIESEKEEYENGDGSFSMNSSLDKIPILNDNEFELAVKLAKEQGWELTLYIDNHQSTTYKNEKDII